MGTSLVDEMVLVADELRAMRGEFGADAYLVYQVVRTADLGEPGYSTSVDVEVQILPTPIVKNMAELRRRHEFQGAEESGVVVLEEVSLTYTHTELVPVLNEGQELLYKLVEAAGQGQPARYFTLAAPPVADREKTIGWIMHLRRAEG